MVFGHTVVRKEVKQLSINIELLNKKILVCSWNETPRKLDFYHTRLEIALLPPSPEDSWIQGVFGEAGESAKQNEHSYRKISKALVRLDWVDWESRGAHCIHRKVTLNEFALFSVPV